MSKKLFLVLLIVSIFFILSAVEGFAAVPQKINFQGRLLNITNPGAPTPETGGKTVAFTIYDDPISSLTASWQDLTHQVSCDSQGQFSTVLDFSTGQNPSHPLDFSKPLYLQVNYDGKDLTPRQPLETVPYAFYAVSAETANVAHTAESVLGSTPAGGWKDSGITVELVTPTDRVGIGTSLPVGALHVSSEGNPNALVVKGGNVGIGTSAPSESLYVNGNIIAISSSTNRGLALQNAPQTRFWLSTFGSSGDKLVISTGTTPYAHLMIFDLATSTVALSNVYGKTCPNPGIAVYIDGNGVLGTVSSSKRYKHDVKDLEYDGYKLNAFRPVRFKWNTNNREDIGLIAEDVYSLYPELVPLNKDGQPESVDYARVSVILMKAVQEQQKEIKDLKARIEALERK